MSAKAALSRLKPFGYAAASFGRRALSNLGLAPRRPPVGIVIERADWAIRWWGEFTVEQANRIAPGTAWTTTDPAALTFGVAQFGSQFQWVDWAPYVSPKSRWIATYFHGRYEDSPQMARHIDRFRASVPKLDRIVASATMVRDRLLRWGVPPDKVCVIPIGCETDRFVAPTAEQRADQRARFGIQSHEIVIGSFQKDGDGWDAGDVPKMIKGPDLFLTAIEQLARDLPVFVLLGGPARGYVRSGLERIGVRHAHHYAPNRDELAKLYHALDLYLVTSREEGGPMALMESMSSGVPVVSTRVGMAPDLIEDGVNGALVEVEDVSALVEKARCILALANGGESLKRAARAAVLQTDWSVVGQRHLYEVWQPLLAQDKAGGSVSVD